MSRTRGLRAPVYTRVGLFIDGRQGLYIDLHVSKPGVAQKHIADPLRAVLRGFVQHQVWRTP